MEEKKKQKMEAGLVHPSSEGEEPETKGGAAGLLAGFARTAAFQGSMFITGFGKGLLKVHFGISSQVVSNC